ncbi:hypothetical protein Tco_1490763 [Tanacetum coccineum]
MVEIVDFLNANPIKYALTVNPTIYTSCIEQFWTSAKVKTIKEEVQIQALVDGKKFMLNIDSFYNVIFDWMMLKKKHKSRRTQRKEIEVPQDESPNEESVPTPSNDPLPSGKDRMQLTELMVLCTKLQKQVLDLEEAKTAQAAGDDHMKKEFKAIKEEKVKNFSAKKIKEADKSVKSRNLLTLSSLPTTTIDEITLAQNLIEIKAAKPKAITTAATTVTAVVTRPKAKGVVMQEPSETLSPKLIVSFQNPSQPKDKGKAKMVEPERPLKKKEQIMMDEQMARDLAAQLQTEMEEEDRAARLKEEEDNIALIESWENTQAMMEADYELAKSLQAQEQGELTIEEKSKLFVELMKKRKKHFAELRAQEKRNKPPTKA